MSIVLIALPFLTSLITGQKYWFPSETQVLGPAAYIAMAAVDVFGLCVLFLSRPSPEGDLDSAES